MGSHGGAVTGAEETSTGEMSFGAEGGEVSGSGVAHEAEDEDDGMCTCSHSNKNDNDVASNVRQGNDHHDEVDANAEDPNNPTLDVVSQEEAKPVYSNFKTEEQREVLPMIPDEGAVRGRSDISFDPCSGRFCFIDKKRKMIGVVDYLRWG
ncbi:hypothetical protein BJ165DRAFT_1452470 [Panaeolus papilionaceus]|nr:hypothetical protein BJ165DRAFT_1452470 [Panaeolus papilionaceus]